MTKSNGKIKSYGYAAYNAKDGLKPLKFERRELGKNDILINIDYCGICHSDIHQVRSEWHDTKYPVVPGHEIVGRVADAGSSVKKFKKGDRIGVGCMVDSCQKCEACKSGAEYGCHEGGPTWTYGSIDKKSGGQTYGGYSSNIVVDQNFALKISPKVNLAATAPLLCAGTTTYTPLKYWKVGKGTRVGVLGLGGLGHMAVKIAKSFGADVTVFTRSKQKAKDALRLGAKSTIIIGDRKEMQKHASSFDFIIDTVSGDHDVNNFLSLLKRDGKMVLVGLPSNPLSVGAFSLVGGHRVLAGSGLDGIKGTQEMLDYCAKHKIESDIELIPIQKVNQAYERVIKGDVKYRFVIDMSSLKKQKA
jgi:alcohol dehydrogenase (NADP+)